MACVACGRTCIDNQCVGCRVDEDDCTCSPVEKGRVVELANGSTISPLPRDSPDRVVGSRPLDRGLFIPFRVFRERYGVGLPPMQALAWYLTQDPGGPGLSHALAGELMGVSAGQVGTHVRRARVRFGSGTFKQG